MDSDAYKAKKKYLIHNFLLKMDLYFNKHEYLKFWIFYSKYEFS